MKINKKYLTLSNQETLAYIEEGNPKNKTILLIHGNFSSGAHYLILINRLKEHYHVIAPDMRGFGDSTYHNRIKSLKELGDDLILLMDELKIKSAVIAGWSLGGGVAMEMAAHYPKRIEKLILISSTTHKGYPVYQKDENLQQIIGRPYKSPEDMANDPVHVLPLLHAINSHDYQKMSNAFDAMFTGTPNPKLLDLITTEALKQKNLIDVDWAISNINMSNIQSPYNPGEGTIKNIKCPVFHLWGKRDLWLAPEYMTLDNFKALKENSILKRYDTSHMIFIDDESAIDDIIYFIEGNLK